MSNVYMAGCIDVVTRKVSHDTARKTLLKLGPRSLAHALSARQLLKLLFTATY